MSEATRRQSIRQALTRAGHLVIAYPAGPFGGRGVSDFIVCASPSGRLVAIEVKDDSGKATPAQELFLQSVRSRGGCAFIAHTAEEAMEGVERALSEVPERKYFC